MPSDWFSFHLFSRCGNLLRGGASRMINHCHSDMKIALRFSSVSLSGLGCWWMLNERGFHDLYRIRFKEYMYNRKWIQFVIALDAIAMKAFKTGTFRVIWFALVPFCVRYHDLLSQPPHACSLAHLGRARVKGRKGSVYPPPQPPTSPPPPPPTPIPP